MMKTKTILSLALLFLTLMTGCSSDDEVTDSPQMLVGAWEMEYSYPVDVLPGESVFEFQEDGVLSVVSKSEFINDTYLLPTGLYRYSLTRNEISFEGNNIIFQYEIGEDNLQLSFSKKLIHDNEYPLYLQYKFHRK